MVKVFRVLKFKDKKIKLKIKDKNKVFLFNVFINVYKERLIVWVI